MSESESEYRFTGQKTVTLKPAYFFICDECGKKTYGSVRMITSSIADEFAEMLRDFGVRHDKMYAEDYDFPESVVCKNCQTTYEVEDVE